MRTLVIDGMSVKRAGDFLPLHVRLSKKIGPGDYIVVDTEGDICAGPCPTFDDAAKELYDLAGVEVKNGLPVYSKTQAQFSPDPCIAALGDGMHFIHDPERPDRLRVAA